MARKSTKRVEARFFRQGAKEPVRVWLKELLAGDRKTIGIDIMTVEFAWPVGMPLVRPLGGGLHEVRSTVSVGEVRVFFGVEGAVMVLLHAIIKKTRATPADDLALARRRLALFRAEQKEEDA